MSLFYPIRITELLYAISIEFKLLIFTTHLHTVFIQIGIRLVDLKKRNKSHSENFITYSWGKIYIYIYIHQRKIFHGGARNKKIFLPVLDH